MKKASLAVLLSSVLATGTVFAQSSYGDTNTMGGSATGSADQSQLQNQQQPASTESTTTPATPSHAKKHKKSSSKSDAGKSDTSKSW